MKLKFKIFLFFIFSTLIVFPQSVKKDSLRTYNLDEVVITATRIKMNKLSTGSSISIIDSSEIENLKKNNVYDLLKNQYGVTYTQGGTGVASIYLRGDNPGHTLILLDGVELNMTNDPQNVFDFAGLNVNNLDRIEILRGPQSTVYGSDAMSGVINIISKENAAKPKIYLNAEGGTYNTYKGSLGSDGKINNIGYSVFLNKYKTDGFSSASKLYGNTEKDGSTIYNLNSKLMFDIFPELKANVYYYYTKTDVALDQQGGVLGDDPTYKGKSEESFFRAEEKLNLFNNSLESALGFSYAHNIRKYVSDSTEFYQYDSRSYYDGARIKFDWVNNIKASKYFNLIAGAEFQEENANSEYYSTFYNSVFDKNKNNTSSVFLQDQTNLWDKLFINAGVRYDKNERFGSITTYRFAPAYYLDEFKLKIRGSIGNGFKAPSLFYIYDPVYGNKTLKPEKSLGADLGFEKYLFNGKMEFGSNYFYTDYKDLFGSDSLFRTINTGKAIIQGLELFANVNVFQGLDLKLNYTYTDTKDKTVYTDNTSNLLKANKSLLRRAYNKAGLYISYSPLKEINSGIELVYNGKRDDIDFNYPARRVKLSDYLLLNISVAYSILNCAEVYIKGENLLNRKYEEIYGYAVPERSVYGGFKIVL